MPHAIEVQNLSKSFHSTASLKNYLPGFKKQTTRALLNVSLHLEQGKILALLGPNGAGKTTLIKILSTLILPDSGTAKIHGSDVVRHAREAKSRLSLVLCEERSFYWRLTGKQNLEFFGSLYGLSGKSTKAKINRAQELFELDQLDKRYQEYSTGNKQKLALARAFLSDASVLFMDEPTRSLDPAAAEHLRAMIKAFASEDSSRTILFSTHNLVEAEELADQISILNQGKFVGSGSLSEMQLRIKDPNASLETIYRKLTNVNRHYEEDAQMTTKQAQRLPRPTSLASQ